MRFVSNFKGLTCILKASIQAQIEKILVGNSKDVTLNQKPPLLHSNWIHRENLVHIEALIEFNGRLAFDSKFIDSSKN